MGDAETLYSWFHRITGGNRTELAQRRLASCMFEENAAFFGHCTWKSRQLFACSFQILVVDGKNLSSFRHNDAACTPIYYRLDIEENFTGNLFDHAVPHVHCGGNNAPRFPFPIPSGESALAAFLEFVYHHHYYSKWLEWAKNECAGDPIANVQRCEKLFQTGSIDPEQASHVEVLGRIKTRLVAARRGRSHRLNVIPESWNVLNYHS